MKAKIINYDAGRRHARCQKCHKGVIGHVVEVELGHIYPTYVFLHKDCFIDVIVQFEKIIN